MAGTQCSVELVRGPNTTPVHGHTALFGVYGMLGIGLMVGREWTEGAIRFGFWAINIGLFLMVAISLLPIGLALTWAAIDKVRGGSAAPNSTTARLRCSAGCAFPATPSSPSVRWPSAGSCSAC